MENKCLYSGCSNKPNYGTIRLKPEYCGYHKLVGMKFVMDKTCLSCNKYPCYVSKF